METKNEDTCLKIRSTRATVAAGLRLYMGNFRRIFYTTWLPALLCALFSGVQSQMLIPAMARTLATQANLANGNIGEGLSEYLLLSCLSLLNIIAMLLFFSYTFHLLSRHREEGIIPIPAKWLTKPDGRSLARTVAVGIVWFVVSLAVMVVCSVVIGIGLGLKSMTTVGLGLLLGLVFAVLLLPLAYPSMRYLTTRDTRLFDLLGSGYRQGWRYWGYIFAVFFVVAIIFAIILSVTTLPAIVLFTANIKAQAGASIGDPLGMPEYMGWMSLLAFTLAGFIQTYILQAAFMPAYYMTGSIEQQEIQRNETKTNTLH